jgi:hypothetical protein
VFGNVLSQSGAYWWRPDADPEWEWLPRRYAERERLPVRFYLDVGDGERRGLPGRHGGQRTAAPGALEVVRRDGRGRTLRRARTPWTDSVRWRGGAARVRAYAGPSASPIGRRPTGMLLASRPSPRSSCHTASPAVSAT